MEHRTRLNVDAEPARVIPVLADLSTYPGWNDLVASAVDETTPAGSEPAWSVTLRARLGPVARSKQLRMVRVQRSEYSVRFERSELDDRDHASWVMEAAVSPDVRCSTVDLVLSYDGGLWTTHLDGLLSAAIERASARLPVYLDER